LPEVADQAARGGHVHVAAGRLALEVWRRSARDMERAVEVDVEHRTPFFEAHIKEEAVACDACVIDDAIDAPEVVQGRADDALRTLPLGHALDDRSRLS